MPEDDTLLRAVEDLGAQLPPYLAALVLKVRHDDGRALADQVRAVVDAALPQGVALRFDGAPALHRSTPETCRRLLHIVLAKDLAYDAPRPSYDYDNDSVEAAFSAVATAVGPSAGWWMNRRDLLEEGYPGWTPLLWTTMDAAIVVRGAGSIVVWAIGDED